MQKLYFIQAGEEGPIKIGRSNNVGERLKQLQTAHYEKLIVRCETLLCSEQYAHDVFDKFRMEGEWFEPADLIFQFIDKLNAFKSQFPTALVDEDYDPSRHYVEHTLCETYQVSLSKEYGQNGVNIINKKCRELKLDQVDYIFSLINKDLKQEFDELEKHFQEFQNKISSGEVIEVNCH